MKIDALNLIHERGLIPALTETLQELEHRMATLTRLAKTAQLSKAEKLEMLREFQKCYADYWACDAVLQQSKKFEAIASSEGWSIQ